MYILIYHPQDDIVILDDTSPELPLPTVTKKCKIEKSPFHKAGEINSYAWSILHSDEYDKFVFLQDSTILLQQLPLENIGNNLMRPFFYASRSIYNDTSGNGVLDIENKLEFYSELNTIDDVKKVQFMQDCENLRNKVCGQVIFGGMTIWTSKWANILKTKTNFLDIIPLFKIKLHRCYFERLLWVLWKQFQDIENFRDLCICGDIFKHNRAFMKTHSIREINISRANNPYIYKIWQGR